MKKFLIAATATIIGTMAFASSSQAGFKHHFHGNHGFHNGHFGIVINTHRPRYIVDDYGDCFTKKIRRYDRWGNLYIKKVRICD